MNPADAKACSPPCPVGPARKRDRGLSVAAGGPRLGLNDVQMPLSGLSTALERNCLAEMAWVIVVRAQVDRRPSIGGQLMVVVLEHLAEVTPVEVATAKWALLDVFGYGSAGTPGWPRSRPSHHLSCNARRLRVSLPPKSVFRRKRDGAGIRCLRAAIVARDRAAVGPSCTRPPAGRGRSSRRARPLHRMPDLRPHDRLPGPGRVLEHEGLHQAPEAN